MGVHFVLVHGLCGQPEQWRWLEDELRWRGHMTLPLHLPGGKWAADVEAVAAEASGRVVVGHSRGGLVVRALAERFPDLAAGLATIASVAAGARYRWVREVGMIGDDGVYRITDLGRFLALAFPGAPPELEMLTWEQRASRGVPDLPGGRGGEPRLAMVTDDDQAVPLTDQLATAEALGASVVRVPGGHAPHTTQPALIARLLDEHFT